MSLVKLRVLFLMMTLSLLACQQRPGVPANLASPEEAQEIEATKAEINSMALQSGISMDFQSFPVVVVDSYPGSENGKAYCQKDGSGQGVYIGILKSTMDLYLKKFKPVSKDSLLFLILGHEFGHCLFGRNHDESIMQFSGYQIQIQSISGYSNLGNQMSASLMSSSISGLAAHELPQGLKEYYIQEIAGRNRVQSLGDIQAIQGLRMVPQ